MLIYSACTSSISARLATDWQSNFGSPRKSIQSVGSTRLSRSRSRKMCVVGDMFMLSCVGGYKKANPQDR